MTRPLDGKLLKRFIQLAGDKLTGDWVILGGMVLPLLGEEHRLTTDIDIVPVQAAGTDQSLRLMEICEELGLPVESANTAAQLFLRRIDGFETRLKPVLDRGRARIFRPDAFLFIQLKLGRLSESDLLDCLEMLRLEGSGLAARERKALTALARKKGASNAALAERARSLIDALKG